MATTEAPRPSLWSRMRGNRESANVSTTMNLTELMDEYDIQFVDNETGKEFAVVTPKMQIRSVAGNEIGSSSPSPFTSFIRQEYNPALQGLKGLQMYDKMRKSDGTVRGTLRAIKTPALSARWFIQAPCQTVEDEGVTAQNKEIVDFIWRNLTEMMSVSWSQVLTESMLMCDFGYYMFEKVWENRIVDGVERTVLAKLAPRHPMDVKMWYYDENGGPAGVMMYAPISVNNLLGEKFIPIDKLLVFSFDREAGNIEGISVLRSAYKHWYYKEQLYKIDAIQKERHGIGIPVIVLPLGFKDEDKIAAENLGRNIRTNERAHIVLPPGWQINMLKLEGNLVNALDSVDHHDDAIRENILVNFIVAGAQEHDLVMFMKASRFVADIVADTFSQYLIPQMVKYNWPDQERMPRLQARRIGETADWRTLSFAIRNLIGAGVIIPDETLEANIREEMDLPLIDKSTARLIATPQNPYDVNEEMMQQGAAAGQDPAEGLDQGNPSNQDGSAGQDTHNQNNPNYNRGRKQLIRKRSTARRNNGQARQAPVGKAQNSFGLPRSNGGTDRSGG